MRIAREALTFDDVLLQPDYSDVLPREVDMTTKLTPEINLNIPLLASAMDSVTQSQLSNALPPEGGSDETHRNLRAEQPATPDLLFNKFE